MSTESPTPEPPDHGVTSAWVRPVAVILSCLVLGFVGGWLLRGDDGDVTVLAPTDGAGAVTGAAPDGNGTTADATVGTAAGTAPAATAGTTPAETTGTVTGGTTGTASAPPGGTPGRADVALAVLNGTSVSGLAADTAGRAETLGYADVTTGNAPTTTSPSVVYFRPGAREAAERAADDLAVVTVRPIPRSGALADAAPADAQVVLVLGSG